MKAEPAFDFADVATGLNQRRIPFLLIGRQAVRLYGSTCFSVDFDLWLPSTHRLATFEYLEDALGYKMSDDRRGVRPIVHVHAGLGQIDLIFVRAIRNQEGQTLDFEGVYGRSVERQDSGLVLRIPAIDDLIALKKVRLPHPRDEEDIRYLEVRKSLEERGGLAPADHREVAGGAVPVSRGRRKPPE
ncbi:MAG: hypothetical protein AMXMBFR64_33030 [Myxococcales bacterium]